MESCPFRIICPIDGHTSTVNILTIMSKIRLEAVMWVSGIYVVFRVFPPMAEPFSQCLQCCHRVLFPQGAIATGCRAYSVGSSLRVCTASIARGFVFEDLDFTSV